MSTVRAACWKRTNAKCRPRHGEFRYRSKTGVYSSFVFASRSVRPWKINHYFLFKNEYFTWMIILRPSRLFCISSISSGSGISSPIFTCHFSLLFFSVSFAFLSRARNSVVAVWNFTKCSSRFEGTISFLLRILLIWWIAPIWRCSVGSPAPDFEHKLLGELFGGLGFSLSADWTSEVDAFTISRLFFLCNSVISFLIDLSTSVFFDSLTWSETNASSTGAFLFSRANSRFFWVVSRPGRQLPFSSQRSTFRSKVENWIVIVAEHVTNSVGLKAT